MASLIPENQASFSHAELVESSGGSCPPFAGETRGVWTDSRSVQPEGLFVALAGERFDGHEFVAAAVERGARVVVVEKPVQGSGPANVLRVPSTLRALGELGHLHRCRWGGKLIGVAGSVGKTTTRSCIAAVLRATGLAVHSPRGNLNNLVGVPMVLLGLTPLHAACVAELGTNQRGEIERLAGIAAPDLAVLTRISLEHAEGLGNLDGIEQEEGAVLRALGPDGVAVVNADDERCVRQAQASRARQVRYGLLAEAARSGAEYRIVNYELLGPQRTRVRLERPSAGPLAIDSPLLGLPGAYAVAAAVAAAEALLRRPLTLAELERALASTELGEPGRLSVVELPDGSLILDDTYNSSPASVRSSVSVARDFARRRSSRLLLALGEMRELGAESAAAHLELGADLRAFEPDLLVAFGGDAALFIEGLRGVPPGGVGRPPPRALFAEDALGALDLVRAQRRPGDVILVKASRGLRAERLVAGLRGSESTAT